LNFSLISGIIIFGSLPSYSKYKMLNKRLVVATALAAGVAAIPVPGVDVAINTVFLLLEVRHYMSVFGIDREREILFYPDH
jgi:hypothetical protein